ncbi:MAG: hypothetical protein IPH11_12745 [Ignavibacteriales bacterium]|nr:hypothetical protein [Ignavibacteriales bacterium]
MRDLDLAYKGWLYEQNKLRIKEQEKQYAYYSGNENKILKYLDDALSLNYPSDHIAEMQKYYLPLTKKIINQMAVVYKEPAKRSFEEEVITEEYGLMLPDNINTIDKRAHRFSKLSNVSLTFVGIDKKQKKIKYWVEPTYKYTVEVDEDMELTRVTYPKYYTDDKGEDQLYTVVWTDKDHYLLDEFGNDKAIKDNKKMLNPYGVIPFADLIIDQGEGYWGEGQNDIINVNEKVNVLLTKLITNDLILGTEGTDVAINLELNKKGSVENQIRKLKRGVKYPIVVENARSDGGLLAPSLTNVAHDLHITEIMDFIETEVNHISTLKGLRAGDILSAVKDTSDYQKIMDSLTQMEMRRDDYDPCRTYEKKRFEITKTVWNTHAQELGAKEFDNKDFSLIIDFAEIEVHKTIQDEQLENEFGLKYNLSTPVDWLRKKNPDLTKEDAEKQIEENKSYNSQFSQKPMSKLEELLNKNKTGVETPDANKIISEKIK